MSVAYFICLSLVAGWAVNLIADTTPGGLPIWANRYLPFHYLLHRRESSSTDTNGLHVGTDKLFFRHIAVWGITAYLGCVAYLASESFSHGIVLSVLAWCFLTIAVIDIEHRLVLNRVLLWMLPIILTCNSVLELPSISSSLLGGIIGFSLFLVLAIAWPGGMGMGDVKLAGVIGLTTGISGVLVAIFVGILSGGVAATAILITTRMRSNVTMAYAPYLVLGAWVALFSGPGFWTI